MKSSSNDNNSISSDGSPIILKIPQHQSTLNKTIETSLNKRLFESEMSANFVRFRNENLFTDVSIYVDGVEFPCHKVIICAASQYFKAMFSCDLKEARMGKVFIENISPWTMKRILDFIYTGHIDILPDTVVDIFNAAVMFQLIDLASICANFIEDHVDCSNCVEIHLFASQHCLVDLEKKTFDFILENFTQLLSKNRHHHFNKSTVVAPTSTLTSSSSSSSYSHPDTPESLSTDNENAPISNENEIVRLSESTFSALLKSDFLNVSKEVHVYYALIKWMENYETINTSHQLTNESQKSNFLN
jgi:hypothetical protein